MALIGYFQTSNGVGFNNAYVKACVVDSTDVCAFTVEVYACAEHRHSNRQPIFVDTLYCTVGTNQTSAAYDYLRSISPYSAMADDV